ncbi:HipA domain-containing protein [Burkholderia cenocepacia]|uniref:HipA domain-containing protein n=2 Tax=Burkholderia cenocepacia TaxID=95486 RepID=UPI00097C9251|nr:HipA domain-containing protein [Burkholderia cenocepacia]AQQ44498.1 toxin HipA [Burkholderia cenocepacia]MBR8118173.1 HipA domain-containing protein [Burkholderia cenocepacia]MBR8262673.1 HipA domain-containing protein [Burkholderia cenocepacia]MBR8440120.1 HipA domain-containing protein [Burkholderia cenocepacia]ONJ15076.1 toxin HipA [Burkholderia cenocepacia]
MAARTLIASANGVRMGTLADDKGIWSFAYDPQWLASPTAYPLSPAFPLRADVFTDTSTDRPVQWFFDNLLPEEGMRTSLAREAKVDAADAWGLLAYFGRESAGALTLLTDGEQETPGDLQPLPLDELEHRIQAMPERALTATAPKRMSAAGAQQKLLLVLRGDAPDYALFEPVGSEPSMHLLKPDMRAARYPHSAINEFFCMRLAKKMGLDVPDVHFLRAPSACYVIDRFDRDVASERAARVHTIDAMQLLNYDRGFKYQRANAQELARAIDRTSTRALTRLSVFRWTVFNVVVGNADAHLKNLSFFVDARGYRLAPFYDIVSTVVYHTPTHRPDHRGDHWPHCELTMPLGNATRFADIDTNALVAFGHALGLREKAATSELQRFLEPLDRHVGETLDEVRNIAHPDAAEMRLLNSIAAMPIAEMGRALRQARG